jgi:hypothetical protein
MSLHKTIIVHSFEFTHPRTGYPERGAHMRTEASVDLLDGWIVSDTAKAVDASLVDDTGRFRPEWAVWDMQCASCGGTGITPGGKPCRDCETARDRVPGAREAMAIDDPMNKLDEIAEIGRRLRKLQDQESKATGAGALATVNRLQEEIAELVRRKETLLAGPIS